MEDYGLKINSLKSNAPNKGQFEQLIEFAKYIWGEIQTPIPLWNLIQATEISFVAENNLEWEIFWREFYLNLLERY